MAPRERINEVYTGNLVETRQEAEIYVANEDAFLDQFQPLFENDPHENEWSLDYALEWFANGVSAYSPLCNARQMAVAYNRYCQQRGGEGYTLIA